MIPKYKKILLASAVVAITAGMFVSPIHAAQTTDTIEMSSTSLVFSLDAEIPLTPKTSFHEEPPTIVIDFPDQKVVGSLPERSVVNQGPVKLIETKYYRNLSPGGKRFIESVKIILSAPYAYVVHSEAGNLVIDVSHPASIGGVSLKVGMNGGSVIKGLKQRQISERFKAMQAALFSASPIQRQSQINQKVRRTASAPAITGIAPEITEPTIVPAATVFKSSQEPQANNKTAAAFALVILIVAIASWFMRRREAARFASQPPTIEKSHKVSSGAVLIDQLLWRAFERQGYQLVNVKEVKDPSGTFRVISRNGTNAALMYLGYGQFFEKQTVDQFAALLREARVEQGFLAAPGSFTVPAQRSAKTQHVTLVARDQLTELLSAGATSEYVSTQLQELCVRLDEAKELLEKSKKELVDLRRQRNEASWHLGEERAKSGKLEAQLAALSQQVSHQESELQRWDKESTRIRKQLEEKEWYLGESKARVNHLEEQVKTFEVLAKKTESAERDREETSWYLGEEKAHNQTLLADLDNMQQALEDSLRRERDLWQALNWFRQEVQAIREFGERRDSERVRIIRSMTADLINKDDEVLASGSVCDLSLNGVGLETDKEIPKSRSMRIRLNIPECDPIVSKTRVVWQRSNGQVSSSYHSGYKLSGIASSNRTLIEQFIDEIKSS